jgi:hypothetical protein
MLLGAHSQVKGNLVGSEHLVLIAVDAAMDKRHRAASASPLAGATAPVFSFKNFRRFTTPLTLVVS